MNDKARGKGKDKDEEIDLIGTLGADVPAGGRRVKGNSEVLGGNIDGGGGVRRQGRMGNILTTNMEKAEQVVEPGVAMRSKRKRR